jgi:hypothetical protein
LRAPPITPGSADHPAAARIAIPNLGMIVPTECNVWINLRLMVGFVSMMELIG